MVITVGAFHLRESTTATSITEEEIIHKREMLVSRGVTTCSPLLTNLVEQLLKLFEYIESFFTWLLTGRVN